MTLDITPQRITPRRIALTGLMLAICAAGLALGLARLFPRQTPVAIEEAIPLISLEEAQSRVDFAIPQPGWLPEALTLKGAHVDPPTWANVVYSPDDGRQGGLGIATFWGVPHTNYFYPDSARQPVSVNGRSASCVQGAWSEMEQWESDADAANLEWSVGGSSYSVSQGGLGLTCADLVRVAESLGR